MSTPREWFTQALHVLNAIDAVQSAPNPEDESLCLAVYNRLAGQWNTRQRMSYYIRSQNFTFTTSKASYTIGKSVNTPDFVVSSGGAPIHLQSAQLVLTDVSPNVQLNMGILNQDQYQLVNIPELSSQFPHILYYERSFPNGTIRPWPAFPTRTSFQLSLQWWNQLGKLATADLANDVPLPDGQEEALVLSLAEKLYMSFPGATDLAELKRQARVARADYQSNNAPPPKIATTDGVLNRPSGFNWLTRSVI